MNIAFEKPCGVHVVIARKIVRRNTNGEALRRERNRNHNPKPSLFCIHSFNSFSTFSTGA